MEKLIEISNRRLSITNNDFVRNIYSEIEWNSRCILLNGCRGVGKTYLIFQYLKTKGDKAIYISLDNLYFSSNSLSDAVEVLYKLGYRYFGIDEIHKYETWSQEIKSINDNYLDIQLILSSSSALDVLKGIGDLSRRLDTYTMKGLSFLEFLRYEYNVELNAVRWEDLLTSHEELYEMYYDKYGIQNKFNTYLKKGYYPYFKEASTKYYDRLQEVIFQVIEVDMAAIFNTDYVSSRQIKKLLALISNIGPFVPNISKLARDLSVNRISLLKYIDYLAKADIISILKSPNKSDSVLTKPEKIYFENTNLLFAFHSDLKNTGTLRETFAMNALSNALEVSMPLVGDFMIENKYVLEVGGKNKNFSQLVGIPNVTLIKDGIERGGKNVIPLWCLGFLVQK